MLSMWKENYILRRFTEQKFVQGIPVQGYEEMTVKIDLQPNGNESQTDESGKRLSGGLIGYSKEEIRTTNKDAGINGDWVWYNGAWYECVSSELFRHTPLKHYTSRFVRVSEAVPNVSKEAPTED